MMKTDPYLKNLQIELIVFRHVEEHLGIPYGQLKFSDTFVDHYCCDSLDTTEFILDLEDELGIEPTAEEYSKVYTVEDLINLFKKYNKT